MEAESFLLSGYGLRTALEARTNWKALGQFANVSQPARTKGILVSPEYGTPFLAATQVFDLRPIPRKWLSIPKIQHADSLYVQQADILVTRSGSVGRATLAYAPHLNTLISDDLLRVKAKDQKHWGWVYAYLRAPTTRAMMTSAQYGHVIKHLEVGHLNALPVPVLRDSVLDYFTERVRTILDLRDQAHTATLEAEQRFADCFGPMPTYNKGEACFSVSAETAFFGKRRRMDALPHNPTVDAVNQHLAGNNNDSYKLRDLGYRIWLPNRFRRIPAEDGVSLVESSDLFEINPDYKKKIADISFGDDNNGRVEEGWLLLARSGQIYGINGSLALSTKAHVNKVVSDDVIRIAPIASKDKSDLRPGYLFVAMTHPYFGRPVVKSLAYGSSIPHIDPADVAELNIVRLAHDIENNIADLSEEAANLYSEADLIETTIADEADSILSRFVAGDV